MPDDLKPGESRTYGERKHGVYSPAVAKPEPVEVMAECPNGWVLVANGHAHWARAERVRG